MRFAHPNLLFALFLSVPCWPATQPTTFQHEAVLSADPYASDVGARILAQGGNATDAAVATAFALAVTHPQAGNIGGGGFLVYRDHNGKAQSYDFRETAPTGSKPTMWLKDGKYSEELHHDSCLSVGVPGTVAGLYLAWKEHGSKPWKMLVDPAIKLARQGFKVTRHLDVAFNMMRQKLERHESTVTQFFKGGKPYSEGEMLKQPALALSLERIRDHGPAGFYEGKTAELIEKQMKKCGGLISRADLKDYKAIKREPVKGMYRDYEIIGMGPPSSGGVAIIEALKILAAYDLKKIGFETAQSYHLIAEASRRAFADRAQYLGDPEFSKVPVDMLLSPEHIAELLKSVDPKKASVSSLTSFVWPHESDETTHISIVDKQRNAVSLTYTLEAGFGSGLVVEGAGFLLNNEMGDFNAGPGLTDTQGHIGTAPNLAEAKKRMLSSMAPVIVTKGNKLFMVTGSPGGRTIINTVLMTLLGVIDFGLNAQEAVDAPRIHHQWLPDELRVEKDRLAKEMLTALSTLGHKVVEGRPQGEAEVIVVNADNSLSVGVDRRWPDGKASGK